MFYWAPPTAADLARTAYRVEDYPPPVAHLWPENWLVLEIFSRYCTQWRVGPSGVVGLDYSVLFLEIDRHGLTGDEREDLMDALRVVERAAIEQINGN